MATGEAARAQAEHLDKDGNVVDVHEWLPNGRFEPPLTLGPGESITFLGADISTAAGASALAGYSVLEHQRDECHRRGKMWSHRANWTFVALPVVVLTLVASLLWSPVVWDVLCYLAAVVVIAGAVMNILAGRWYRKSTALSNRMIAMTEESIRRLRR